tara:strand:- start:4891 stop:5244 length:354 start_codon:yes stop_codon:yes gene_type:complete
MAADETGVTVSSLKTPMQSKKFVAFLIAEVTWKVIIFVITYMGMKNGAVDLMTGSLILACVLIAGFVEAGYIIGQGSLDKYLGLAQIAAQNGHSIKLKGAEITKHDPLPPAEEGDDG